MAGIEQAITQLTEAMTRTADGLQAELDRLRGLGGDALSPEELDGLQQQVDALREDAEAVVVADAAPSEGNADAGSTQRGEPVVQQVGEQLPADSVTQAGEQAGQPVEAAPSEPGTAAGEAPDQGTAQAAPTSTGDPAAQAQEAAATAAQAAQEAAQAAQEAQEGEQQP